MITGVDSGMGPPKRHGNAWRTVGELMEGGYTVEEALAAATSLAAAACGLTGQTGRLAEGYAADILVTDGDLSHDISHLSRPREVLVRGTPADPTAAAVSRSEEDAPPRADTGTVASRVRRERPEPMSSCLVGSARSGVVARQAKSALVMPSAWPSGHWTTSIR